jgi:hypothetical protein
MTTGTEGVWIQGQDGELVAGDSLIRLRCENGTVRARYSDGSWLNLTGPGCPPDFQSRPRGRTGLTVPSSPPWPGCCPGACGCTGL